MLSQTQKSSSTLTNVDIISMAKARLSPDVIVAKIGNSNCDFDTSPRALERLKSSGVPDSVILAVVKSHTPDGRKARPSQVRIERAVGPDTSARIICFRSKRFYGRDLKPSVYVDERQVVRLQNGRYFSVQVPAGEHQIESSMKHSAPLHLQAHPGESLYIEMLILPGTWRGGGRLVPVPLKDGEAAVEQLKPADSKWIAPSTQESAGQPEAPTRPPDAEHDVPTVAEEYEAATSMKAISYRAIPHESTTYLTIPGYSNTSCYGGGIDTGYWTSQNLNCQTVTRPPATAPLTVRWIEVYNTVEANGDVYTITCTAHWAGSACSWLVPGDRFVSSVRGTTMWILAKRGGNMGKKLRIKFRILDIRPY
ncbi:MAG: DUF2846 domain-containing protein [Terriglobia bacterium]